MKIEPTIVERLHDKLETLDLLVLHVMNNGGELDRQSQIQLQAQINSAIAELALFSQVMFIASDSRKGDIDGGSQT